MHRVEIDNSGELLVLAEMLHAVSREHDPAQMLRRYGEHFWKVRELDYMVSLSTRGLPQGQYKITRAIEPQQVSSETEPPNPWRDWDRMEAHTGGFFGELIRDPRPQLLHDLDLTNDPVVGDMLSEMRSCIASPLFDDGEALNWNVQFHRGPRFYREEHLADHFLTTNIIGTSTRNLIAVNRAKELNAKLTAQLEAVARVQKALLPTKTPEIPGLAIATSYLTSDEAGGDYYDFFPMPGGTWGILIADVSGHGAAAATVMAMLHAILHGYEGPEYSAKAVMEYANRRLSASRIESTFVTAFFGVYDPATGRMQYARAGHNPPRLKTGGSGEVRGIEDAAGLPLGIVDDFDQQTGCVELAPGDTLVLYTDGITEAFSVEREQFGLGRLDSALVGCSGQPDCVVDSVHKALFNHTHTMKRDDDQTIVALRREA